MPVAKSSDLQKQIDEIDTKLYNLLMMRTDLVKLQPDAGAVENTLGKEAAVIKKLLRIHRADFPEYVIAKIWREILSASAGLKGKLKFSVFNSESCEGLINIVQEHFGSYADYENYSSFGQVMNDISTKAAQLAIIPCDNHEMNERPWWSALSSGKKNLKIVAKLPFLKRKEAAPDENDVYVVALAQPDESGDDISLLGIEVANELSTSLIVENLESNGFENAKVLIGAPVDPETKSYLVEVSGFLKPKDKRFDKIKELFNNINIVGSYAKPIKL